MFCSLTTAVGSIFACALRPNCGQKSSRELMGDAAEGWMGYEVVTGMTNEPQNQSLPLVTQFGTRPGSPGGGES
jgi:hypothetical protein